MRGRRLRLLLVTLAVLAVLASVKAVALWPQTDRVTLDNFNRLRVGMTRAEVRAILGPRGDFKTRDPFHVVAGPRIGDETVLYRGYVEWERWDAERIDVGYARDGTVKAAMYYANVMSYPPDGHKPGTYEIFQGRLKRQWRRWFND